MPLAIGGLFKWNNSATTALLMYTCISTSQCKGKEMLQLSTILDLAYDKMMAADKDF